jgi:hypothetical protein
MVFGCWSVIRLQKEVIKHTCMALGEFAFWPQYTTTLALLWQLGVCTTITIKDLSTESDDSRVRPLRLTIHDSLSFQQQRYIGTFQDYQPERSSCFREFIY